jgi:hypothetical protein
MNVKSQNFVYRYLVPADVLEQVQEAAPQVLPLTKSSPLKVLSVLDEITEERNLRYGIDGAPYYQAHVKEITAVYNVDIRYENQHFQGNNPEMNEILIARVLRGFGLGMKRHGDGTVVNWNLAQLEILKKAVR